MPRVNIYIRNEDLPKWKAIENRAEWLHKVIQLGYDEYQISMNPIMVAVPKSRRYDAYVQKNLNKKSLGFCEHGAAKGLCKFGCK